jgi:hypothetical protein
MSNTENGLLANWNAGMLDRYRKRLEAGHHDRDCEQRERYGLCDCRKRERLRDGRTGVPPILIYQAPVCDGCGQEVYTDAGDSWECERCHVSWGMSDFEQPGKWSDDTGTHEASTFENYGERMIVLATTRPIPPEGTDDA